MKLLIIKTPFHHSQVRLFFVYILHYLLNSLVIIILPLCLHPGLVPWHITLLLPHLAPNLMCGAEAEDEVDVVEVAECWVSDGHLDHEDDGGMVRSSSR